MSELETELRELRDGLRSSMVRPGLGRVADRARQRIVRRRMQVGAITAVVLVSVAVPVLRSLPPAELPPTERPPARTMVYEVDFADAERGYALGSGCEDTKGPCTFTLLATTDRGRTWRPRKPPADDRVYYSGHLTVVDANRLRFVRLPYGTGQPVTLFASEDAGRTWHRDNATIGPVGPVPSGAQLQLICARSGSIGKCPTGVGTLDDDGRLSPTPGQPPAEVQMVGETATAGGRYWVASRDPNTRGWAVSVTSDAGRTWATSWLDLPGEPGVDTPWAVVEGGGVLYTVVQGSVGNGPSGLMAVFRSTDGGVSWNQTWRATPTTRLTAVAGSAIATPDGHLVLYSTTEGTLESTDGQRFSPTDRQVPGPVTWTRAGYLAKVAKNEYELSSDGRHWQSFSVTSR